MTVADQIKQDAPYRKVRLTDAHIEHIYSTIKRTQQRRYLSWLTRHEEMATDRDYVMPRISEFYSRALINQEAREALHVTRRAVEAVTKHTVNGSQGYVAQLDVVLDTLNARREEPNTAGWHSLIRCRELLKANS